MFAPHAGDKRPRASQDQPADGPQLAPFITVRNQGSDVYLYVSRAVPIAELRMLLNEPHGYTGCLDGMANPFYKCHITGDATKLAELFISAQCMGYAWSLDFLEQTAMELSLNALSRSVPFLINMKKA